MASNNHDPVTGTLTPTTPLGDGHQFTTTLTDAVGNESPQSGPATDGEHRRAPCPTGEHQRSRHPRG